MKPAKMYAVLRKKSRKNAVLWVLPGTISDTHGGSVLAFVKRYDRSWEGARIDGWYCARITISEGWDK